MNGTICISISDYQILKRKADNWDFSKFDPNLINDKIKKDLETKYGKEYYFAKERLRTKLENTVDSLYTRSLFGYISVDSVKSEIAKVIDSLNLNY